MAGIGIGICTHNRPELFRKGLAAHKRLAPPDSVLVIVDDASAAPVPEADFRFEEQAGIARAKNKALELLAEHGVQHFFLFDDDTWPRAKSWWRPYVESAEPHLTYTWGLPRFTDGTLNAFVSPKGCMLYADRSVLERVGGMDPRFGIWGHEHVSWSDRIHNAGLTSHRYQDIARSGGLFHASDQHALIKSSVPERTRQEANVPLLESSATSDAFIDYRESTPEAEAESTIALSILVPSVHTRRSTFGPKIQDQLFGQWEALPQADRERVEILMLTDTKSMMLGHKRNVMIDIAQGRYVQFVDDDDRVEPDMIKEVLAAIDDSAPDVITFLVSVSLDGAEPKLCRYSKDYGRDHDTATEYRRIPNHICVVRKELAAQVAFPNILYREDQGYSKLLLPLLQTEHKIKKVLYHYDYSTTQTETQVHLRYQHRLVRRTQPPVMDVIMLSKAEDDEFQAMTQKAIDSCIAGASGLSVNVIVVEQVPGTKYRDAFVIEQPGDFHYNRFANLGAKAGSAPWIMIANNDLIFENGWLHHLLSAGHPIVSPHNPGDRRQGGVIKNETGAINGRHLSGWCYALERSLWERLGGLDEDFFGWCADDAVIEQVGALGIRPMLVPKSRVRHLMSKTLSKVEDPEERMTWGQVALFNRKYGQNKFSRDKRFLAWQARQK